MTKESDNTPRRTSVGVSMLKEADREENITKLKNKAYDEGYTQAIQECIAVVEGIDDGGGGNGRRIKIQLLTALRKLK